MRKVKKTRFVQQRSGWCAVYNLANLYDNELALDFLKKEEYKGCDTAKEEDIIHYLGEPTLTHSIISVVETYEPLPKDYVYRLLKSMYKVDFENGKTGSEDFVIPVLLSIKLSKGSNYFHRVHCLLYKDTMFYSDPFSEDLLEIESFRDFDTLFHSVVDAVRLKVKVGDEYQYCIFKIDEPNHLYHWIKEEYYVL